jgi:acyl-coenzyme A thioesterase PaaI-like protein
MNIITHQSIDAELCGNPIELKTNSSKIEFIATQRMAADQSGLVHGGFIFGLADYAAMLAVNDPNVVLGSAEVKFIKPVKVNESLLAEAKVISSEGMKHIVNVWVKRETDTVFTGEFICFVLKKHVLDG